MDNADKVDNNDPFLVGVEMMNESIAGLKAV